MTLVELMIGLAIGLVVTTGCLLLWASQLREERSRLAGTWLTQDLRAALALMTRDLRRAGYWGAAPTAIASGDGPAPANPYAALSTSAGAIAYRYTLDPLENGSVDPNEQFGFRLRSGVLEMQLGSGNWQALTDSATLVVTTFRVEPMAQTLDLSDFCARPCTSAGCPRQELRGLELTIVARLPNDATVTRGVRERVSLRNDLTSGECAP